MLQHTSGKMKVRVENYVREVVHRRVGLWYHTINATSVLLNFGMGENECIIHADNCAGNSVLLPLAHAGILSFFSFLSYNIDLIVSIGQNKNRYVLAYFCWRILLGLHK